MHYIGEQHVKYIVERAYRHEAIDSPNKALT